MDLNYKLFFYMKDAIDEGISVKIANAYKNVKPENIHIYKISDTWYSVTINFNSKHRRDAIDMCEGFLNTLKSTDCITTNTCLTQQVNTCSNTAVNKDYNKKPHNHKNKFYNNSKKPISQKQQSILKTLLNI